MQKIIFMLFLDWPPIGCIMHMDKIKYDSLHSCDPRGRASDRSTAVGILDLLEAISSLRC